MDIKIGEELLKKATKCEKNFSCLSEQKRDVCKINYVAKYQTVFLEKESGKPCKYLVPISDSFICICPVRYEIYKMYGF